jgi:hypothetical protein
MNKKQPIIAVPLTSIWLLMNKILKQAKELDLLEKTSPERPIDKKQIKF